MPPMQWLFDIIIEQMENAGFIRITDVELYLKGMIVIWSGSFDDVPDGWALCDGDNGTPDLRFRFVWGPNINALVGVTGGAANHDHDFTGDGHPHSLTAGVDIAAGTDWHKNTNFTAASGTTDSESNLPPYMFLAFIMKL